MGYDLFLPSPAIRIGAAMVVIGTFIGVWLLDRRGARRLQEEIDDIDALTGRNE